MSLISEEAVVSERRLWISMGPRALRLPVPLAHFFVPLPPACTCAGCHPIPEQVPTPGLVPERVQGRIPG